MSNHDEVFVYLAFALGTAIGFACGLLWGLVLATRQIARALTALGHEGDKAGSKKE